MYVMDVAIATVCSAVHMLGFAIMEKVSYCMCRDCDHDIDTVLNNSTITICQTENVQDNIGFSRLQDVG